MSSLEQILARAGTRRAEHQLPYAGAVSPDEAFELLQLEPSAKVWGPSTDWKPRTRSVMPAAAQLCRVSEL